MATAHTTVDAAGLSWGPRALIRRLRSGDEVARLITLLFALVVVLLTVLLVDQLSINSAEARHRFGLVFFWTRQWDPVFNKFGALPLFYGTLVTSALGLLIVVPLVIRAAI